MRTMHGCRQEVTRALSSSEKSRSGGPQTASIPQTLDPPEGTSTRADLPGGNNPSTTRSPPPPTCQRRVSRIGDRRSAVCRIAMPKCGRVRTRQVDRIRAGRPRPAASRTSIGRWGLHAFGPTRRRKLWPQAMESCWAEWVRGIINGETDTLWENRRPYSRQRCRCRPGSFWSTSQ